MCTVREGQNSFPKAWSTLKIGRKPVHSWSEQPFYCFTTTRAQRFLCTQHTPLLPFLCQYNSTPTGQSCHHLGLPMWASRLRGHRVRYVAWRWAVTVLHIQSGQQPGRALPVIAWPPVCEGRQIPFHEAWLGKQTVSSPVSKSTQVAKGKEKSADPTCGCESGSLRGWSFWLIGLHSMMSSPSFHQS